METLKIKPGSFLLWKEHSRITKLFSKLFHKELPYNNFSFFLREIELCFPITKGKHDISIVYTAPGLKYGLIFSITGFIIYGIVIIMEHKKGKKL